RVGGGDPEQRLAVAPAGHVGVVVFELEAEKAEQLAVELLRARKVADAEHQVIDADNAGHGVSPFVAFERSYSVSSLPGLTRQSILFEKSFAKGMDPRVKPAGDGQQQSNKSSSTGPAGASRRACRRGRRSSAGRDDKAWILCPARDPFRRAWVCAGRNPRPACGEREPSEARRGRGEGRRARSRSAWRWGRRGPRGRGRVGGW